MASTAKKTPEPEGFAEPAAAWFDAMAEGDERAPFICDGLIDLAAALFQVSGRELRHAGRSSMPVSRVRQIAMYVAHVTLSLPMGEIGRGFGRDRTTVLHACHVIEDLRDDAEFDSIVAMMERVAAVAFGNLVAK